MKTILLTAMIGLGLALQAMAGEDGKAEREAFRDGLKQKRQQHHEQQKAENKEFRQTLKDKSPNERAAALKDHFAAQYAENREFRAKIQEEVKAFAKGRMEAKGVAAEKIQERLAKMDSRFAESSAHRDQQAQENQALLGQLAQDADLTKEEMREAMKAHFSKQREENKQWRQDHCGKKSETKKD